MHKVLKSIVLFVLVLAYFNCSYAQEPGLPWGTPTGATIVNGKLYINGALYPPTYNALPVTGSLFYPKRNGSIAFKQTVGSDTSLYVFMNGWKPMPMYDTAMVHKLTPETLFGKKTLNDTTFFNKTIVVQTVTSIPQTLFSANTTDGYKNYFTITSSNSGSVIGMSSNNSSGQATNPYLLQIKADYLDSIIAGTYRTLVLDAYGQVVLRGSSGVGSNDSAISFKSGSNILGVFHKNGKFTLPQYTYTGAFTAGVAKYLIALDSSGNVMQYPLGIPSVGSADSLAHIAASNYATLTGTQTLTNKTIDESEITNLATDIANRPTGSGSPGSLLRWNTSTSINNSILTDNGLSLIALGDVFINSDNTSMGADASSNSRLGFVKKAGSAPVIAGGSAQDIIFGHWSTPNLLGNVGTGTFTENVRINIAGNTGFGNVSPLEKIDVTGNIRLSGIAKQGSDTLSTMAYARSLAAHSSNTDSLGGIAASGYVLTSRSITTGTFLTGGGNLTANRVFNVDTSQHANASSTGFLSNFDWKHFNGLTLDQILQNGNYGFSSREADFIGLLTYKTEVRSGAVQVQDTATSKFSGINITGNSGSLVLANSLTGNFNQLTAPYVGAGTVNLYFPKNSGNIPVSINGTFADSTGNIVLNSPTGGIGGVNYVQKSNGTSLVNSVIQDNGSNIGIGTTADAVNKVTVGNTATNGDAIFGYNYGSNGTAFGTFNYTGAGGSGIIGYSYVTDSATTSGNAYGVQGISTTSALTRSGTNIGGYFTASRAANTYALITDQGIVGLGTTTPTATNKVTINEVGLANSGSLAGTALGINQTWNTTGVPTALKVNVTNTASGSGSKLMDLQVGGGSVFNVTASGNVGIVTASPETTSGITINGSSDNLLGTTIEHYRNVASFNFVGADTGTMKITLPQGWTNTMMTMVIKGYNYSSIGGWEVHVSGYNYGPTSAAWVNTKAEILGSAPFNQVRLAYDSATSKVVVLLGTTTTAWSYPKVEVTDFIAGHSNITGWGSGWTIAPVTSEAQIGSITGANITTYLAANGNFGFNNVNPLEALDVIGNIRLSGLVKQGSDTLATQAYVRNPANYPKDTIQTVGKLKATTISSTNITLTNTSDSLNNAQMVYQAIGSTIKAEPLGTDISKITTGVGLNTGELNLMLVYLPNDTTITGVKWFSNSLGAYNSSNYNGVMLFSLSAGTATLIDSSPNDTAIWKSGTAGTFLSKAFTATHRLTKGTYVIGLLYNTSLQTTIPSFGGMNPTLVSSVQNGDFTNSVRLYAKIFTQLTVPSSFAYSTTTATANKIYAALY